MIHVEQKEEELPVEFRIDKSTEWEHVQTLVLMLSERKMFASQDMQMVTPPWEAKELMTSHYHSNSRVCQQQPNHIQVCSGKINGLQDLGKCLQHSSATVSLQGVWYYWQIKRK